MSEARSRRFISTCAALALAVIAGCGEEAEESSPQPPPSPEHVVLVRGKLFTSDLRLRHAL